MYCLCVNVYCQRVTTQLQLTNIYHNISYFFVCVVVFLDPYGTIYMVSEELNFSRMGLSGPCPTPSYPGGPIFSVGFVSLS